MEKEKLCMSAWSIDTKISKTKRLKLSRTFTPIIRMKNLNVIKLFNHTAQINLNPRVQVVKALR